MLADKLLSVKIEYLFSKNPQSQKSLLLKKQQQQKTKS